MPSRSITTVLSRSGISEARTRRPLRTCMRHAKRPCAAAARLVPWIVADHRSGTLPSVARTGVSNQLGKMAEGASRGSARPLWLRLIVTGSSGRGSAQRLRVPVCDVVRARRGRRERILERVVDTVEHQENVGARERGDVVARTLHDVRVKPQCRTCWPGELIDAVTVGHIGDDLLGGHPDLLLLQGGLVVVFRGLTQARYECLV